MWGFRTGGAIRLWLLLCSAFAMGEASAQPSPETIALGKALTIAGDCASCHTADPAKPFAGGKRIDTPYGVAPNGSRYYPAFPYPNFTKADPRRHFGDRGYLATLAPVRNTVPPPELRFPFNYRVVMRAWNYLFFRPGIIMPDQSKSAAWNRGR